LTESFASPDDAANPDLALEYCAQQVRRYDPDRYFASLMAPGASRNSIIALYAFNLEIAKIREVVSESMLGRIRLQWWRDTIEGIYNGKTRQHSVVVALEAAIESGKLTRRSFETLLEGREFDMEDRPPDDLEELITYAEATSGTLACLTLETIGDVDDAARQAVRHAGIAWALIGVIRAVPFHAMQRRSYIPGMASVPGPGGRRGDALQAVVADIADEARKHLKLAGDMAPKVLRRCPPLTLLSLIARDVRTIERSGYDPFALPQENPFARRVALLRAGLFGGYLLSR
jgi:phytoene synthase